MLGGKNSPKQAVIDFALIDALIDIVSIYADFYTEDYI